MRRRFGLPAVVVSRITGTRGSPADRQTRPRSRTLLVSILAAAAGSQVAPVRAAGPLKPNIVSILADDLGYGDEGCYNPASKIPTPNIDRLAREGVRFTDAHAPSAVCARSSPDGEFVG